MTASRYVDLGDCKVKKLTEKAALIESEAYVGWIPLSQIEDADRLEEGDEDVTILVTEWFADKEGIET